MLSPRHMPGSVLASEAEEVSKADGVPPLWAPNVGETGNDK